MKYNPSRKLKKELDTYQKNKNQLRKEHEGKFVLIKDDKVIDTFNTETEAYEAGVKQFGIDAFLIKQILGSEDEVYYPALLSGLIFNSINADIKP